MRVYARFSFVSVLFGFLFSFFSVLFDDDHRKKNNKNNSVGPDNCKCEPGYGGPTCNIGMLCSFSVSLFFLFDYVSGIWSGPVVAAVALYRTGSSLLFPTDMENLLKISSGKIVCGVQTEKLNKSHLFFVVFFL